MKVHNWILTGLLVMSGVAATVSAARAEVTLGNQKIAITTDATFASKYIWRGYNLVNDWVSQPSVNLAFGDTGTALNIWSSWAFDRDYKNADEIDLTLSHTMSITEMFSLNLGAIEYLYPRLDSPGSATTTEVYLGGALAVFLNPTATLYYDLDDGDGAYLLLGASYSYKITDLWTLDPSVALGYNFGQYNKDRKVDDTTFKISTKYTLDPVYLSAAYAYILNNDKQVNPDDESVFTVSVGANF